MKPLEDFVKVLSMLNIFSCVYIIHFYGASFIPNKICMITEYAPYGSLNDLMKKREENPIDKRIRIKILIDSAKGIKYLHINGILHRDIKPDNILITSLDKNVEVNGKLTDFGSSRNINMLMTNMTFTKGVGTPVYMAPEILDRQKYKKTPDIYSFSITMYECLSWRECYPKTLFPKPWDIANFVSKGKRVEKSENMTEEEYLIINNSWKQEAKERINIENIIKELEKLC